MIRGRVSGESPGNESPLRLYVMAAPCTGKTWFARRHPRHRGVRVVDFSERLYRQPRWHWVLRRIAWSFGVPVRIRSPLDRLPAEERLDAWFRLAFRYLAERREPVCLLGPPGAPHPSLRGGVHFAAVVIDEDAHLEFGAARLAGCAWDRSARPQVIRKTRHWVRTYAEAHGIPVFGSFSEAIEAALRGEAALLSADVPAASAPSAPPLRALGGAGLG